ncbi:hypothetical protein [Alloactinosynnema sp. L-07]|nr:hypothetical protein [Alloactinosynnema sp. L-07]
MFFQQATSNASALQACTPAEALRNSGDAPRTIAVRRTP